MKPKDFDKIVNARCAKIKSILASKAKEYSREDRLHNFKRAGVFMGKSPGTVCWGFAMKHFTSIADIVDDVESGSHPPQALVQEKLGDAINYLVLLEAILNERNAEILK